MHVNTIDNSGVSLIARLRHGILIATVALTVSACASTDSVETAALASAPIPTGKARVMITRSNELQYSAAPATITLDGREVASIANGGTAVIDVPAGDSTLAASAWSYPGEYKVKLTAAAGRTYRLEVSPRADSLLPGMLLGPIGGMLDASANENAGAFEMRLVGKQAATSGARSGIERTAPLGNTEDMVRQLKAKVFPEYEFHYVHIDATSKSLAVI